MTMHLEKIRIVSSSKKKKHSSSKAAKMSKANQESWAKLLEKYDVQKPSKKNKNSVLSGYTLEVPEERSTKKYNSKDSGSGNALKTKIDHYSGTDVIGIAVLHKSISVPIFRQQDAVASAQMRR